MSAAAASIEVRNLSYHYPDGTSALDNVSFMLAPGECVGLIGPNGAGKSTLMLHLNGLLPEDHNGQDREAGVFVDGEKICAKNLGTVRRKVGLLFQDPDDQLFCPTVAEDVAFGPRQFGWEPQRVSATVNESLSRVGLVPSAFLQRSPHRLSSGEKRRICLAGVLACEPGALVLDEPTSNLDPRGRREFRALIASLPATRLLATHDLEMVAELCSRAILIDRGRIIAIGPAISLLGDEKLMLDHGLEKPHVLLHHHPHGPTADNHTHSGDAFAIDVKGPQLR